jgi:uncharacterized protein
MNMKKVYIIHGWDGNPQESWFPWLKNKLEERGFQVFVPSMPNSDEPEIDAWVNYLLNLAPEPDENTFFVGHSIGGQAILRYIEKLDNKKIGGIVLVAGWFTLTNLETEEEWEIAEPWMKTPVDFKKVKSAVKKITAIFSDSDPFVPLAENKNIFSESLGAEIIVENKKGHFITEDGVLELRIVLEKILQMANE